MVATDNESIGRDRAPRDPQTYYANEWITDRYGLNKKKTKLARVSGKFRRKTIDRKDYLFEKFTIALTK